MRLRQTLWEPAPRLEWPEKKYEAWQEDECGERERFNVREFTNGKATTSPRQVCVLPISRLAAPR